MPVCDLSCPFHVWQAQVSANMSWNESRSVPQAGRESMLRAENALPCRASNQTLAPHLAFE